MSHPTRVHALSILFARSASPRQIAEEIGERLNNVTYHLKQLQELGCIELTHTEQVHGGRVSEHFYRATRRIYFDEKAWSALSRREQVEIDTTLLRIVSEDIEEAMSAGTFFGEDPHISRSPMAVDEEGYEEVTDVIERATVELLEIQERVANRCADRDPPSVHAKVEILQFRSPAPDERADPPSRDD